MIPCRFWYKLSFLIIVVCLYGLKTKAQQVPKPFLLNISFADKDSAFTPEHFALQTNFLTQETLLDYVDKLPTSMISKGYPVASIDSLWQDSTSWHIILYVGAKYNLVQLQPDKIPQPALDAAGWQARNFTNKPLNIDQVKNLQQRLLDYYETIGYPFASVFLDSVHVLENKITAALRVNPGIEYHIDSIRIYGKTQLNKKFLQRYLDITNGSLYNRRKLSLVDQRILELPYLTSVQASDITMLGSGSVLNLYIEPKKSSQVNFLIGFLPASDASGKLQLTGDVNLDLKNLLGSGEGLLLKWQQLQPKSPRLNIGYDQPYIFNSAFGFNFLFDLFKKDSNFIQVNAQTGLQFALSNNQIGKLFIQWQSSTLLSGAVDTNAIKLQKRLPINIDVSAVNVGFNYEWEQTNFKLNPRSGSVFNVLSLVGIKNVKPNNDIINIKDPFFNYAQLYDTIQLKSYQLRLKLSGAHYFPVGKSATLKTALNAGYYTSPSIFRNELFQIGGYRLLRGFDEESIYAARYAVFTAEYRYLVNLNSYLFAFTDVARVQNKYQAVNVSNNFVGAGVGIVYETKAGVLNLSFALGKRDDVKFNIRQASKIHFGYINYF